MVKVVINKNRSGDIYAFCAHGHAGGEYGTDIHCAAISAILQTAVIGLCDYAGIKAEVSVEDGYLECEISPQDAHSESARAITETMLLGLKAFRTENKRHIKLIEEVL